MEITGNTFYYDWEVKLMVWLQAHAGAFGVKLASFFTQFGEPLILILIFGLFYWGFDKKYGKYIAVNVFSVTLFGPMIKNIALRRRPYFDHESIKCLRPVEAGDIYDISLQGFSFPSLHAANSVNMYTLVGRYLKSKTIRIICAVVPFLVGVSRFVIGVHYPTDVLAGWAIGLLMMLVVDLLLKILPDFKWIFPIFLAAAFPGFFFCKSADFYTAYGILLGTFIAFSFEDRYIRFKPAKNYMFALLRVIIGGAIFVGFSSLLKLPFPKVLLETPSTAAFLIRTARYTVNSFIIFGLYPLCFGKGKLDL